MRQWYYTWNGNLNANLNISARSTVHFLWLEFNCGKSSLISAAKMGAVLGIKFPEWKSQSYYKIGLPHITICG